MYVIGIECWHYGNRIVIAVSCTIWESRDVKKADLSVLDISSAIIARVESMPESMDYFYVGKLFKYLTEHVFRWKYHIGYC